MSEITQEDREAGWDFRPEGYGPLDREAWFSGICDHNRHIQAFAHHRLQERERCAKVADDEMVDATINGMEADYAYNSACRSIATAIRQPKEPSNG